MAKRPDVFDQQTLETSLREQGCPESFVSPAISDYRIIVPLAIRKLGEEGIVDLLNSARHEFGLGPQESAWKAISPYIVGWAEDVLEEYKRQRK